MYKICKRFTFDSSHKLWDKDLSEDENMRIFGKCANAPSHGHTYTCEVRLKGDTLNHGMVVNFTEIKEIVKRVVLDEFDHHFINELMPGQITTAENVAKLFYERIKARLPQLYAIRIWETPNNWAEYRES